jgi:cullin-4
MGWVWVWVIIPSSSHVYFGLTVDILCWVADKPKLPNNFEEVTWVKIKEAVTAIHLKQPISGSLEELYRVILSSFLSIITANKKDCHVKMCVLSIGRKI